MSSSKHTLFLSAKELLYILIQELVEKPFTREELEGQASPTFQLSKWYIN